MNKKLFSFWNDYISSLVTSIEKSNFKNLSKASDLILKTIERKKTIYVCGNGGSAAISNHYICDYMKFLRQNSKLRPRIISLSSRLKTITAIANDINYDQIFKYQAESLFNHNDLLIAISSSGNSPNIREVVKYSKKKKVKVIGFCGFKGGYLKRNSDIAVHVPINNYGVSEDANHILMHVIMQFLAKNSWTKNYILFLSLFNFLTLFIFSWRILFFFSDGFS